MTAASLFHWQAGITTNPLYPTTPNSGGLAILSGDSTSTEANDLTLYSEVRCWNYPGGELDGVTVLDGGNNGASLAAFMTPGTIAKDLAWLIAQAPNVVVFCWGINDVREGAMTLAAFQALLISAIDAIVAALPDTDIVLRVPNSFLSTDPTGTGLVVPLSAAQAYTTLLRTAYLACEGMWPNVVLLDVQELIFGTTCPPLSAAMANQLHPSAWGYTQDAQAIVSVLSRRPPFAPRLAALARLNAPLTPWTFYAREVEDPNYYDVIVANGRTNAAVVAGATTLDIDLGINGDPASRDPERLLASDIVQIGTGPLFKLPTTQSALASPTLLRLLALGSAVPASFAAAMPVTIYRPKFYWDANLQALMEENRTYPTRYRIALANAWNGGIVLADLSNVGEVPILQRAPGNGDVIIFPGNAPLILAGASLSPGPLNLTLNMAFNFAAWSLTQGGGYGFVFSKRHT